METFSALLAICAGNPPVTGGFPSQRPVTRSFDVFFYLRLNKRLSKQSGGWWFETPSRPLWRHRNEIFLTPDHQCIVRDLVATVPADGFMMTSSSGYNFRVTGPLWEETTGNRWIAITKASDAELWCFFYLRLDKRFSKQSSRRWYETPPRSLWRHCNVGNASTFEWQSGYSLNNISCPSTFPSNIL